MKTCEKGLFSVQSSCTVEGYLLQEKHVDSIEETCNTRQEMCKTAARCVYLELNE